MSSDNSQINFNPSWMQPAPVKGEKVNGTPFTSEDEVTQELMDPVFANNRYGREDILALLVKDVKPPDGLSRCSFFVEKAQTPIILQPLNDIELRLQQNINSSKALSAISRQDRNIINGNDPSSPGNSNSKWATAGGNRGFYPHNKPVSNRWGSFGFSSGNGNESLSFRSVKSGGGQSFRSTGTSLRLNEQRSNRFRISSTSNETSITTSTSIETSPSTSTTTGTANAWTKIGGAKSTQDLNSAKSLKSGEDPRLLLLFNNEQEDNLALKQTPTTVSPVQNFAERKEHVNASVSSSVIVSSKSVSPTKSVKIKIDKWYYLDPNGVRRGPYESKQMQAWFACGYFDSTLNICKIEDKNFITLGDLIHINGSVTPFISKSIPRVGGGGDEIKSLDKSSSDNTHYRNVNKANEKYVLSETNNWKNISTASANSNISSIDNIHFLTDVNNVPNVPKIDLDLQKFFIEKQKLIEEEQNKLREKKELLQREEQERLEKERLICEKELELQRKQDELQRIAREKEEELELRRQQVAEFEKQRREALEKMEERLKNERIRQQEEERLRLEAETKRKLEAHRLILEAEERRNLEAQRIKLENERKKREEEEANIRAAYEEARRLQELAAALKAEKEQRERLLIEKERLKRETENTLKAELERKRISEKKEAVEKLRKEEEERQQQELLRRRQMEEELSKRTIQAILNEPPSPTKSKPAPWVTVGNKVCGKKDKLNLKEEHSGKTLLEIQQEEEEALREKLKQQQELLETHRKNAQVSTSWSSKLSGSKGAWGKPTNTSYSPSLEISQPTPKQAATIVSTSSTRSWKQVQNHQPVSIPKAPVKNNNHQQTKKKSNSLQKIAPKDLIEKSKPDAFTFWIIKRVRELSTSVDAEVFASFIEGVDSPNEAEDYMIGYLGESKAVKDFHRDFLNKKIELRPRLVPTKKDDLSGPAAAANDTHSNSATSTVQLTGAVNKKKKKGKPQQVLDLGFKPIGDPNRFNAGEIDTAPPVSTNRKR